MSYHGDITLGDTIDIKFTSRRFSTGAPHTLSGGDVAAYVGNGTTEITAGITLTADFDSRTGLNNVRVVATSGNGFSSGTDVTLVLTAGSVDSVSVAGEVIGSFSIENRHGSAPTAAEVAEAVWDVNASAHDAVGTFGRTLGNTGASIGLWDYVSGVLPVLNDILSGMFVVNTGETYATAVAGSVVKEIVDNTPGGTGASLTDIADAVWDEELSGHTSADTTGRRLGFGIPDATAGSVGGLPLAFDASGRVSVVSFASAALAQFFSVNTGQTYGTSVAGSVVKEIADNVTASVDVDEAAIATAVLETLVPGSFASGSVGHTIGMLSGVTVTVVSPVASDLDITLVRGDAYTARLGRALTFLDTDDTWPDLTDGVVTLEVGDGELTVTGIVVTATGTGKSVRVEPLSSQTEELTEERYDYNLVVTFPGTGTTALDGGDRMTLASGTMHVVDREDA